MTVMTTGRLAVRLLVGAGVLALVALPSAAAGLPPVPPAAIPGFGGQIILAQSSADVAQQSMRIDRLEDQMRQLNGRIDEMTYSLQQIQQMLQRMQEDNEFRFRELEGGKPRKRSEAPPAAPNADFAAAPANAVGDPPRDENDVTVITNVPEDAPSDLTAGFSIDPPIDGGGTGDYGTPPQVLGTIPAPASSGSGGPLDLSAIARGDLTGQGGYPDQSGTPGVDGGYGMDNGVTDPAPGLPEAVATAPLEAPPGATATDAPLSPAARTQVASLGDAVPEDPRGSYDRAYGYVVAGQYPAAEMALKQFLAEHPKDKLAGSARYWLGETYYAQGQYRDAAEAFLTTYRDFPKSSKAPESLLKLGLSLEGLGEKDAACATYREVEKKFPSAGGALTAKVNDRKTKAGC